jgi:hypothetical protein
MYKSQNNGVRVPEVSIPMQKLIKTRFCATNMHASIGPCRAYIRDSVRLEAFATEGVSSSMAIFERISIIWCCYPAINMWWHSRLEWFGKCASYLKIKKNNKTSWLFVVKRNNCAINSNINPNTVSGHYPATIFIPYILWQQSERQKILKWNTTSIPWILSALIILTL